MEETIISRQDKIWLNESNYNLKPQQKSMMKSRIKAMKSRIFWSRKNSQSSIEKIKVKLKLQPLNKLQQQRQRHLKLRDELDELAKKLSLPKLKESISSMHCNQKQAKKLRKKAIEKSSLILAGKQVKENSWKRQSLGEETLNQILFKYNKRCESQIGLFRFGSGSLTNRFFHGQANSTMNIQKLTIKNQQNGGCVPKNMVKYLRKFIR